MDHDIINTRTLSFGSLEHLELLKFLMREEYHLRNEDASLYLDYKV